MPYLTTTHCIDTGHQFTFLEAQVIRRGQSKVRRLLIGWKYHMWTYNPWLLLCSHRALVCYAGLVTLWDVQMVSWLGTPFAHTAWHVAQVSWRTSAEDVDNHGQGRPWHVFASRAFDYARRSKGWRCILSEFCQNRRAWGASIWNMVNQPAADEYRHK